MGNIALRGRITKDGQVELLDALPITIDDELEVTVLLQPRPTVYETVNEYGDPVIVDEEDGTVTPLNWYTTEELLNSPLIGMWADRIDEMKSGAEWVKKMREEEQEKSDHWHGRTIS